MNTRLCNRFKPSTSLRISAIVPFHNGGILAKRTLHALLSQEIPQGCELQIVAVDDGSNDGSTTGIESLLGARGSILRLDPNMGRCAARNAGASASQDADILLFVDGDCVPMPGLVSAHAMAFARGADTSFGDLSIPGDSFWARLQRDGAARRVRKFESGETWAFTSANFAVRRELFMRAGGFDAVFNRHGFEDRDLFARLSQAGARHAFTSGAIVLHEDEISLGSVSRKIGEAGYHAAGAFRNRHPEVYAKMAYSRIDCSLRPWLRVVDKVLWPLARQVGTRPDASWLEWRAIPFFARALAARTIYGLWFLHGTARRRYANTE